MIKKTEFETLEELQRVYPIGSIFSTSIEKERWYCPSEKDIKAAISIWGEENVTVLNEDIIVVTKKFNTYVQGYIFDGEYWRPAGNGWDGWYEPIDFFGGVDNFIEQQKRDNLKMEYCKNNNINLFIIKYNEDIKEKMEEIFSELYCE